VTSLPLHLIQWMTERPKQTCVWPEQMRNSYEWIRAQPSVQCIPAIRPSVWIEAMATASMSDPGTFRLRIRHQPTSPSSEDPIERPEKLDKPTIRKRKLLCTCEMLHTSDPDDFIHFLGYMHFYESESGAACDRRSDSFGRLSSI
jgi:hypothetical protein